MIERFLGGLFYHFGLRKQLFSKEFYICYLNTINLIYPKLGPPELGLFTIFLLFQFKTIPLFELSF